MKKKYSRLFKDVIETVVMTLVVFLVLVTFVVQGYKVSGSCMEPNLFTGERLLGNKFIYRFERPVRGDVIVFKYPPDPRKVFIKRVVGLPGDTIEIDSGTVLINSKPLNERVYVINAPHGDFGPHKVSKDHLFVLGDNRDESNDSRFWGELPMRDVQAKAWLRYWPFARLSAFK